MTYYSLIVYDLSKAPEDKNEWLEWHYSQNAWNDSGEYLAHPAILNELKNFLTKLIWKASPSGSEFNNSFNVHLRGYILFDDMIYVTFNWSAAKEAQDLVIDLAQEYGLGIYDADYYHTEKATQAGFLRLKNESAMSTEQVYSPWKVLEIEETIDEYKIIKAYMEKLNICGVSNICGIREIVLAELLTREFAETNLKNPDFQIEINQSGKVNYYYYHWYFLHLYLLEQPDEFFILRTIRVALRTLLIKDVEDFNVEVFQDIVPLLTYEVLVTNGYYKGLLTAIKDTLQQLFENFASIDYQGINTVTKHLDEIFILAFKNNAVSREMFLFGKWASGFIVKLNEFPKYATHPKQPIKRSKNYENLEFSRLIRNFQSVDKEIHQLIIDLKAIKEPDISSEKIKKLLSHINAEIIENENFIDFYNELMIYISDHRWFLSERPNLLSMIKEYFDLLEVNEDNGWLDKIREELAGFSREFGRKHQEKMDEDRLLFGKKIEKEPDEVIRQKSKLQRLYNDLTNQGRYGFWIVSMPKKDASFGLRLNYLNGKWSIYTPSSAAILETEDLEEAIEFYRKEILSEDSNHLVAYFRTQEKIYEMKRVLDDNNITSFQQDEIKTAYSEQAFRLFVKNEDIFRVQKLYKQLPNSSHAKQYLFDNPPILIKSRAIGSKLVSLLKGNNR